MGRENVIRELADTAQELCFKVDTAVKRLSAAADGATLATVKGDLENLVADLIHHKLAVRAAIKRLKPKP